MDTEPRTPEAWGERYRLELGAYEALAERTRALLCDLSERAGIDLVQTEARAKTVDSFVEKVRRKNDRYDNPLADVTDLAGVRLITYYVEDVERIVQLLHEEFLVDGENSVPRRPASVPTSSVTYRIT